MRQVQAETGGRPFANDDLVVMQQEVYAAIAAQYLNKGGFIVSGCYVSGPATGATITEGIVLLGGQFLRFSGQSSVVLPAQFQPGAEVLSDPRPYQTGGTKYCMREVPAVIAALGTSTPGEFIPINSAGGKRWEHVQIATLRSVGEVQWLACLNGDDYDDNGRGKPGTEAWGWALCDGRDGRLDLRQRFAAGYDPATTAYAVGTTGGAQQVTLGVQHLPPHNHTVDASNAGGSRGNTLAKASNDQGGTVDFPTKNTGGGQAFSIVPQYVALVARQWVEF